ncbi:Hypothetical predicted protein [Mytilus galloprovincialis]|uniref:Uncharacterized protein n=1 Tax=Mytilus galloprovincialis TaxID=29158 RepID=A0A8B6CV06_MYTGA|nr:Hypothetical predicted protein [Mytilus galloprovincialis]
MEKIDNIEIEIIEDELNTKEEKEKVVFPDGTVYSLTASWVSDPTLAMLQEAGLQTSTEKVGVSDKEVNTPQFYNAWSIGEKCVDTSDLFLSVSN